MTLNKPWYDAPPLSCVEGSGQSSPSSSYQAWVTLLFLILPIHSFIIFCSSPHTTVMTKHGERWTGNGKYCVWLIKSSVYPILFRRQKMVWAWTGEAFVSWISLWHYNLAAANTKKVCSAPSYGLWTKTYILQHQHPWATNHAFQQRSSCDTVVGIYYSKNQGHHPHYILPYRTD